MNGTKWSITYVNYHAIIVLFTCLFANIVWQQGRMKQQLLVGGLEHFFYDFPYICNVIKSTDDVIFFRRVGQPPTSHSLVFFLLNLNSNSTFFGKVLEAGNWGWMDEETTKVQ
jgi:hypothetical protein